MCVCVCTYVCPLDPKKGTQTMDSDLDNYGQDIDHKNELGRIML